MDGDDLTEFKITAQLLTIRQVSIIIQVHPNTVLNYLAAGKLKGHNPNGDKKGLRVTVSSVREYLKSFLIDNFDEKSFDSQVEELTQPAVQKAPVRRHHRGGWVKNY